MTKRLQITLLTVLAAALCIALVFGCVSLAPKTYAATVSEDGATITFDKLADFNVSEDRTTIGLSPTSSIEVDGKKVYTSLGLKRESLDKITDEIENVIIDMSSEEFDGITKIEQYAFSGNTVLSYNPGDNRNKKISRIILPKEITAIGKNAFDSTALSGEFTLPQTLVSLGSGVFGSTSVSAFSIPSSITTLVTSALSTNLKNIAVRIAERSDILTFEKNVFGNLTYAKEISVPSLDIWLGKVKLNGTVFNETSDLVVAGQRVQGKVVVPNGITDISQGAFAGYSGITEIVIPNSVTGIGKEAFFKSTLAKVTYEDLDNSQLNKIDEMAFGATRLVEFVIPKSVTDIGDGIFGYNRYSCTNLKSVCNLSTNLTSTAQENLDMVIEDIVGVTEIKTEYNGESVFVNDNGFLFLDGATPELYLYEGAGGDITLPQDFNGNPYNVADYAFIGNNAITGVTIPANSAKAIGVNAFKGCVGLNRIAFNGGVETLGAGVFKNCTSLTSVEFNNTTITEIADEAFYGCTKLNSIVIPASVTRVGNLAYAYCENALSLTFNGDNVSYLGYGVFLSTYSLKEAAIPDSVVENGATAPNTPGIFNQYAEQAAGSVIFAWSGVEKVTIGKGIKNLSQAFAYCENLREVVFADNCAVEDLQSAFRYCPKITGVKLPGSVTSFTSVYGQNENVYAINIPLSIFDTEKLDPGKYPEVNFGTATGINYNIFNNARHNNPIHEFTINAPEKGTVDNAVYGKIIADFLVNFDQVEMSQWAAATSGGFDSKANPAIDNATLIVPNKEAYDAVIAAMTEDWYNGTWFKQSTGSGSESLLRNKYTLDYLKSKVYYLTEVTYEVYKADGTTLLKSEQAYKLMQDNGASVNWTLVTDKNKTQYYSLVESVANAMPAKIGDYETANGTWYVGDNEVTVDTKVVDGIVFKSVLAKEVINVSDFTAEYTGSAWNVADNAPYAIKSIANSNGDTVARAINAGTYSVTLKLKDDTQEFANGTTETTVTLTITKKAAEVIWTWNGEELSADSIPSKTYDGKPIADEKLVISFKGVGNETITIDNATDLFRYLNNEQQSSATGVGLWRLEIPELILNGKFGNYALTHTSQQFRINNIVLTAQDVINGTTIDLDGSATLNDAMLYVYEDNSHNVIPSRTPINQTGYTLLEVINVKSSTVRYTNREWTLLAAVASGNADKFALTNTEHNKQTTIGRQITVFTITAKDNYEFALNSVVANAKELGLEVAVADNGKTLTISKTWYVVQLANELVVSTFDGTGEPQDEDLYTVIKQWTYGDNVTFELPKLWHGSESDNNTYVKFTLTKEGVADPIVSNANRADLLNYLNKYMPAGNYTLTINVEAFDTDEASYPTFSRNYDFTVAKASITIDETKLPKGANGYADYEWELTANANKQVFFNEFAAAINKAGVLNTVKMTDTDNANNYWMRDDVKAEYFGDYEVTYNFLRMNNDEYFAANDNDILNLINGGTRGTYTVYFQVEMKNHNNLTDIGDEGRYAYFFTVTVWKKVATPAVSSDGLVYTGNKVQPAIEESELYETVWNSSDSYVAGGQHSVLFRLYDNVHYRWANSTTDTVSVNFTIANADNVFTVALNMLGWNYETFDAAVNNIRAAVRYLDNGKNIKFSVVKADNSAISGLTEFTVDENGKVNSTVAAALNGLKVGQYKLIAKVDGTDNYNELIRDVSFAVAKSINAWADGEDDLVLPSWIVGKFDLEENRIVVKAAHGEAVIEIRDMDGNVYYNSTSPEDNTLNTLDVGKYLLVAWVAESEDYAALAERSFTIEVLEKIGLPWWGTLLVVVGALAVAAAIILILWKLKVFEILTDKISLAITTRATVDATIAAVRATKRTEEADAHKRKVEARERLEAAREANRNKTPEQRAEELAAKAEVTATKADKLAKRADKMRERADKLAGRTEQPDDVTDDAPGQVDETADSNVTDAE